jgi:hypothetical protein
LLFEQVAHQPQRRPGVTAMLNQHVEDLALVQLRPVDQQTSGAGPRI